MVRTRFAPSPTGYMHIGNLRTALYEYLIAKVNNGEFILRIEDTDQERFVEGSMDVVYKALELAGIKYDEGPLVGGDYGPYIQSERKHIYSKYAKQLIDEKKAYYCFCSKERLEEIAKDKQGADLSYDRRCRDLDEDLIQEKLANNEKFVIRQKTPLSGKASFYDEIYGTISIDNETIEDQILIKADGLPTYNFANVVDDHLMNITHVVRGSEYLSSTPKYNLLYHAFDWEIPKYIHVSPIMKDEHKKLSKRDGDASFEDLLDKGYLVEAVINYIVLLGWSPADNEEFFTLNELEKVFSIKGLSKSPAIFDYKKLDWMNAEYIKQMDFDDYYSHIEDRMNRVIKSTVDKKAVAKLLQNRISRFTEIDDLVDFFNEISDYDSEIYLHKKMKTDRENSLESLKKILSLFKGIDDWSEDKIHEDLMNLVKEMDVKTGQVLWPLRTALSGKSSSAGGGIDLAVVFGKDESIKRIEYAIEKLGK